MPTQTPRGFPYLMPSDHPLEYPAVSQGLAQAIESRGLLIAQVSKVADQSGIASGGSAGITCTLPGLRVGAEVLGLFNLLATTAASTNSYLRLTGLTGATILTSPGETRLISPAGAQYQQTFFALFQATATQMSVGMAPAFSNGQVWTCAAGTSITLISL